MRNVNHFTKNYVRKKDQDFFKICSGILKSVNKIIN